MNGELTPYGVFYRAENIDLISSAGWTQLQTSGIRTIVDLRQPNERSSDLQKRPDWLTVMHTDLDGIENDSFWQPYLAQGLESTSMYYLEHLKQMPERASEALEMIVTAPEGGVLFHCKSGRDRTGLIALLLLAIADVEPEEIIDDYLETIRLGEARGKRLARDNPEPVLEALLQKHGTSTEGSFRNVVKTFELSDFLKRTTLSEFAIQSLKTWRGAIAD
jgi:protein tyrosine/serine phosphatase